jgi:hypothetical protein
MLLIFALPWPTVGTTARRLASSTANADKTMNDGSDLLPPAKLARMGEFLRSVFGSRYSVEANRFISRYETRFGAIRKSFADRAGRVQHVLAYQAVETPRGEYVEARCQWEKAVMLVRLTFDEEGQVTGFWLARDREGPTPKGFRRGGYVVGEPMLKLAGYTNLKYTNFHSLTLHVQLTALGGGPLQKPPRRISVWKQTTDPDAHSSSAGALVTLLDGTRWQWVRASTHAVQSQCTFEELSPGKYRVVAGHSGRFDYLSDPIRVVDPSKPTTFTGEYVAPVYVKHNITLKLVDSKTGVPAERFEPHVRYFDSQLAPSRYSTQYYNMDKIDGGWQFDRSLRTGRAKLVIYGVWCHLPNGDRAVLPRYVHEFDVPALTSEGAEPIELALDLTTPEMTDVEAAELWPWEVYGTVKDQAGQPLAGIRVHAHCGVGSAEVAETHSAADGSYRLRLASSPYYRSKRIGSATVAKAWIQADGPDMAEFTLSQQGDIGLIEDGDEPIPGSLRHHHLRPGFFVKRNEPFGPVDFVMTPEVKLEVELLDTEGRPIVGRYVSFMVDAVGDSRSAYKDASGIYRIDQVPVGQVGKISVAGTTDLPSIKWPRPMRFTEGGTYRIIAQTVALETTHRRFDLAIRSATDADGRDVLEQILVDEG